jgi:4-amino-4-deoxy-L-arabinose transferase-like glycosyltransferase
LRDHITAINLAFKSFSGQASPSSHPFLKGALLTMLSLDRSGIIILSAISAALVLLAAIASDGIYNIDELGYILSAEALRDTGGFVVANGREEFASLDLKIELHVDGPQGMVSQYPVGTAWAAQPLMGVFGLHSLIVLNLLAGIGTLLTSYALAMRLFASRRVAILSVLLLTLCSFWAEYVVGHWPHSVSIFLVTLACLMFQIALERNHRAWHPAVWSGAVVGLGMFFRLEGILLLPGIAALTILYAKRPVQVLLGGMIGMAPLLGLMSLTNNARFGTLSPVSYGGGGGGTDLTNYIIPGLVILAGLAGLVGLRLLSGSRRVPLVLLLGAGAFVAAAVMIAPLQSAVLRVITGIHAILIDATILQDDRAGGLERMADGTVLFWGLPKKALAQSLPWLGCLAALAGLARAEQQRSSLFVLMIFAGWSVPFIIGSWHGGFGANMRYFLPMVPLLCALAAWVIVALTQRLHSGDMRMVRAAVVAAALATVLWLTFEPAAADRLHQIVSLYLFIGIALTAFLAGFLPQRAPTLLAVYAISLGLVLSSGLAVYDYTKAQLHRQYAETYTKRVADIDGKALFYGSARWFHPAFAKPDQIVAMRDERRARLDFDLIEQACRNGYTVYFDQYIVPFTEDLVDRLIDFDWDPKNQVVNLKQLVC